MLFPDGALLAVAYSGAGAQQQQSSNHLLNSGLAAHTMSSPMLKHNAHLQLGSHDRPKD